MKKRSKGAICLVIISAVIFAGISCFGVFAASIGHIIGDADSDETVSVMDATFIQKVICEIEEKPTDFADYADVNDDGYVDIKDATLIQKYLAEYNTDSRIGEEITEAVITTEPETTYNIKETGEGGWQNVILKP